MTQQELEIQKLAAQVTALTLAVKVLMLTHHDPLRLSQLLRSSVQGYEGANLSSGLQDQALEAGMALLRSLE